MSKIIKIALITAAVSAAFMLVFMQNIQKTEKVVIVEKTYLQALLSQRMQ